MPGTVYPNLGAAFTRAFWIAFGFASQASRRWTVSAPQHAWSPDLCPCGFLKRQDSPHRPVYYALVPPLALTPRIVPQENGTRVLTYAPRTS